ncbi:bifunctional riboflavin kinase/FAD synthetase [Hathewaya massiliensis]|uniref:bifunctional riboflavin kinase/FAD synthetase n=1 Tax=Hathewaya massiliensis TaxID=1964382 RepID=UPI00115B83FA|nr:bifunctional riboflavin kinase/FAD synthetase [Hathewaya massiliensis]
MIIIEDNFKEKLLYNTYIALGSFDGLHKGHLSLIRKAVTLAKENHCKSMVYTFKNHPMSIINKERMPKLIQSNKDKIKILEKEEVDILNFANFNQEYMEIKPEEFIKKLLEFYKAKGIVVGFNYKFGYKNQGNIELLKELSKVYDFELFVFEPVKCNEDIISSTYIRNLIKNGSVADVVSILDRPFSIEGIVIEGKKLGRQLGFPTINLKFDDQMIIPKRGVYFTAVEYKEKVFKGITNVGFNPTVNGTSLSIETYVLDFHKEVYGEEVKVYFLERIRDEEKFSSLDKLVEILKQDKEYAEKKEFKL